MFQHRITRVFVAHAVVTVRTKRTVWSPSVHRARITRGARELFGAVASTKLLDRKFAMPHLTRCYFINQNVEKETGKKEVMVIEFDGRCLCCCVDIIRHVMVGNGEMRRNRPRQTERKLTG